MSLRKTLLAGLMAGAAAVASMASAATSSDINGMWLVKNPSPALTDVDGKPIPLKPGVRRSRAKDPDADCVPPGPLRSMYYPYPVKVLSRPGQVTLMHEFNHLVRIIRLDKPQVEDSPNNWLGSSVGKWEGDTLVVDTWGLNGETWLDKTGLPASKDFRMVERISMPDNNTLEDTITVTDPKNYARTWSTKVTFERRSDLRLEESVCKDSVRKLPIPPKP